MPVIPRPSAMDAPYHMAAKPSPSCNRPSENFTGVLGSRFRVPRNVHIELKISPKIMMKIALADWKVEAGTTLPLMPMPTWSAVTTHSCSSGVAGMFGRSIISSTCGSSFSRS